jgi:DNA-binding NarL/FixJ family response regulator
MGHLLFLFGIGFRYGTVGLPARNDWRGSAHAIAQCVDLSLVRGKGGFMSISVSSLLSTASVAAANASSTSAANRTPQPTTNDPAYKVTLTEAQQVYQLYDRGQPISQIATSLSLTQSAVNNYLGIVGGAG